MCRTLPSTSPVVPQLALGKHEVYGPLAIGRRQFQKGHKLAFPFTTYPDG